MSTREDRKSGLLVGFQKMERHVAGAMEGIQSPEAWVDCQGYLIIRDLPGWEIRLLDFDSVSAALGEMAHLARKTSLSRECLIEAIEAGEAHFRSLGL